MWNAGKFYIFWDYIPTFQNWEWNSDLRKERMGKFQKECDIREGGQNQVLHCSSTYDHKMAGDGFFVAITTAAAFCVWGRRQSVCFCMAFTSTVSGSGSLMTKSATKSERRLCATDKHWNWGSKADSAWKHPIFPNNLDGFYWIHMG